MTGRKVIPGTSGEWFNTKRIEKHCPDAALRMIGGIRGTGKTVWATSQMAIDWERGKQSVWSRLFKDHMKDPSFYSHFLSGAQRLGKVPEEWVASREGVFTSESMDEQVCIFMDINTGFSRQGNEYDDVAALYVDEYTVRPGEMYPRNYVGKLTSLIGTLGRSREMTTTMMSNRTSISNPIWAAANIYPGKYDVTAFPEKSMVIEICKSGYYNQDMPADDSPVGKALLALGAKKMEDEEEDPSFNLVEPKRPGDCVPDILVLSTESGLYRRWKGKKTYWEPLETPNSNDWIFTTDIRFVNANVLLAPSTTMQRLRKEIEQGRVRFKTFTTLYSVMSAVYSRYQ